MDKNYLKAIWRTLICLLSVALMVFILYNALFLQWWAIVTILVILGIAFFLAVVEVFYVHMKEDETNKRNTPMT